MNSITLDFESFFSDEYTLKGSTTESYIRDPRFEAHGCAIRWCMKDPPLGYAQGETHWYGPRELNGDRVTAPDFPIGSIFESIDWDNTACLCHHAQFDGLILSHHYGIRPKYWLDTLSMARLLLGNHLSVGLDSLAKHFGLAAKTVPYDLFKGKHWRELTPEIQKLVADGCRHDVELTWQLFNILAKDFPGEEYPCIDATIRMFTEPCLKGNIPKLTKVWEQENDDKHRRLADLDVDPKHLRSDPIFADLLRAEGVEPGTKNGNVDSKTGGPRTIYAFAKTDPFMQELLEHDDKRVRTLAEARLGEKSTLLQTRAATLGWMARRGPLCVYLRYAGAHTSRWSGGDRANWQNGVPVLNDAIEAPEGYRLIKPDASQVECRILNFVAGQEDKIEDFRLGRDPYIGVAEEFCGHKITKESHPELRQAGKVVELQAGYGSGGGKIRATLRNKVGILITPEEGEKYKRVYRDTHPRVVDLWAQGGRVISRLAGGKPMRWGPVEIRDHRMWLPNGIPLIYDTLEYYRPGADEEVKDFERDGYWRLRTRGGWTRLYGSKLVENLIQALARLVISEAMVRIIRMGYRVVNMRHDDLWILIPTDGHEAEHTERCRLELKREPLWLPGIPLDAEVH